MYPCLQQPRLFVNWASLVNTLLRNFQWHPCIHLFVYSSVLRTCFWGVWMGHLMGEGIKADLEDQVQSFSTCGSPSPDGLPSTLRHQTSFLPLPSLCLSSKRKPFCSLEGQEVPFPTCLCLPFPLLRIHSLLLFQSSEWGALLVTAFLFSLLLSHLFTCMFGLYFSCTFLFNVL